MGVILDSSAVIAGERKGRTAADLLADLRTILGKEALALSTVSVVELEHGVWRAKEPGQMASAGGSSMICLRRFRVIHSRSTSRDRWGDRCGVETQRRGDPVSGSGDRGDCTGI
jgi:hypothetical protein